MFGSGFSAIYSIFSIIFLVILCSIVVTVIRNIKQWNKNNKSPVLIVEAKVVTKRTMMNRDPSMNNDSGDQTSTVYFITFEVESGDRMELIVSGNAYGMLVEGDVGKLTFQGTRFLDFTRIR